MNQRVLITGVTGFVGQQVLHHLAVQRVRMTVVVRIDKQEILKNHPFVEAVITTLDLFAESVNWWANILQGIDTVIHVAWYAEPGKYLHSIRNLDCLQGTISMARGAAQAGVRRFVGIGTCAEYDLAYGIVSVETQLKPLTPYAGAKAATFLALSQWLPSQGMEFAWCRLFYLYGESEDPRRLVSYLRTKLAVGEPVELTSGNQIRDFIDVSEAGRLIADIALSTRQGPINICSGIPITVKQLAENVADEYGRRDLLKFGVRQDNLLDPPCVVGVRHTL